MATVNFPASPSTNDTYTENSKTWIFNGTGWQVQSNNATLAPLDSPALTGNPTAPTPSAGDDDTSIATTAFVQAAVIQSGPLAGFRNAFINGNFDIWQRGTTFTTTGFIRTADKWNTSKDGSGSITTSRQEFTLGQTAVPGEPKYFIRINQTTAGTGTTYSLFAQKIEGVNSFAGQQIAFSLWIKASANLTLDPYGADVIGNFKQSFGTGGSPSADAYTSLTVSDLVEGSNSLTTSWQKWVIVKTVPSISGKTLGTNNNDYLEVYLNLPQNSTFTIDIAQAQFESGPVATPFERRPIGTELALCQRYCYQINDGGQVGGPLAVGFSDGTTTFTGIVFFPVTMRIPPSSLVTTGTASNYRTRSATAITTCNTVPAMGDPSANGAYISVTTSSGQVNGDACILDSANISTFIRFEADL